MAVFKTAEGWQRHDSTNFPKTWKTFDRINPLNGEVQKFCIQDIPEKMYENVMQLAAERLYVSDPLRTYTEFLSDHTSVAEEKELWRQVLKQRLSLICFVETEGQSPEIASIFISCRCARNDPEREFQGSAIKKISLLTNYVMQNKCAYKEFHRHEMIIGITCVTFPHYYLPQVIANMIESRAKLSISTGITMNFDFATSKAAKRMYTNLGFIPHVVMSYEELEKVNAVFHIHGIQQHAENISLLYFSYV